MKNKIASIVSKVDDHNEHNIFYFLNCFIQVLKPNHCFYIQAHIKFHMNPLSSLTLNSDVCCLSP